MKDPSIFLAGTVYECGKIPLYEPGNVAYLNWWE